MSGVERTLAKLDKSLSSVAEEVKALIDAIYGGKRSRSGTRRKSKPNSLDSLSDLSLFCTPPLHLLTNATSSTPTILTIIDTLIPILIKTYIECKRNIKQTWFMGLSVGLMSLASRIKVLVEFVRDAVVSVDAAIGGLLSGSISLNGREAVGGDMKSRVVEGMDMDADEEAVACVVQLDSEINRLFWRTSTTATVSTTTTITASLSPNGSAAINIRGESDLITQAAPPSLEETTGDTSQTQNVKYTALIGKNAQDLGFVKSNLKSNLKKRKLEVVAGPGTRSDSKMRKRKVLTGKNKCKNNLIDSLHQAANCAMDGGGDTDEIDDIWNLSL